jgi:CheY-like chemotaxis protein
MNNKHILVVEDDKDIRDTFSEILKSEGFTVTVAENGQVALDFLLKGNATPDLIFLDIMMPVMNGQVFYEKMCAIPDLSGIPVVVISAGTEKIEMAATAFMKKPLDLDDVITTALKLCPLA